MDQLLQVCRSFSVVVGATIKLIRRFEKRVGKRAGNLKANGMVSKIRWEVTQSRNGEIVATLRVIRVGNRCAYVACRFQVRPGERRGQIQVFDKKTHCWQNCGVTKLARILRTAKSPELPTNAHGAKVKERRRVRGSGRRKGAIPTMA